MDADLKTQIIRHEGLQRFPYECTSGKLTIGVGRNLDDNGITTDEALFMLDNDIKRSESELKTFGWFTRLSEVRRGVLIELNFNIGLSRLLTFKRMIEALKIFDYEGAAHELLNSKWAKQVGEKRSKAMAYRLLNGIYDKS